MPEGNINAFTLKITKAVFPQTVLPNTLLRAVNRCDTKSIQYSTPLS